jgi:type IV secretory pathway VirB4 component
MNRRKENSGPAFERNVPDLYDLFLPDGLVEEYDRLMLGASRYCRVYAVAVYPREVHPGWLSDSILAIGDIDLSVHVLPVPDRAVITALTKKVTSAYAQRLVDQKAGNILRLPELDEIIRDLEGIREVIQTNRDRMFYVLIMIALHARSAEDLDRRSDLLEDTLARMATQGRVWIMRQAEGLKTSLPLGRQPRGKYPFRNLTSGAVAANVPVANPDLSHPSGVFLGHNYFTGSPIFYDSFIGPPHLLNQHAACFGMAGSGKSATLKLMLLRSALLGVRTVVIDPEREYMRLTEHVGGAHIRLVPGVSSGINPLDVEPEEDEAGNRTINLYDKVTEVRAIIRAAVQDLAGRTLDPQESALLEESLREEYAARNIVCDPESIYETGKTHADGSISVGLTKKEMPTLSDLVRRLSTKPAAENLAVILKPFLRGSSMGMFDCQTAVNISDAPVVCFDVNEIKDEFTRFYAMFVLLGWTWQKFAQKNRDARKRVIVDEAWMFMKHGDTAVFLETLARRGRKHNTSLVVASQHIEEFLGKEEGRAVISNCATLILLRQHPTLVNRVVEEFHLSKGCAQMLETFAPGECLVSLNGSTVAVRVTPAPFEWPLVSTTAGEVLT